MPRPRKRQTGLPGYCYKDRNGFGLAGLFVYSRPNLKTSAFAKNNSADELADRL